MSKIYNNKLTPKICQYEIGELFNLGKPITNDRLAAACGVSRQTFADWLKKYPDLKEAIQVSIKAYCADAENCIIKQFDDRIVTLTETEIDAATKQVLKIKSIKKVIRADWRAAESFLKRYKKNIWGDNTPDNEQENINNFIESLTQTAEEVWDDEDIKQD
jgi:hypothetical protein